MLVKNWKSYNNQYLDHKIDPGTVKILFYRLVLCRKTYFHVCRSFWGPGGGGFRRLVTELGFRRFVIEPPLASFWFSVSGSVGRISWIWKRYRINDLDDGFIQTCRRDQVSQGWDVPLEWKQFEGGWACQRRLITSLVTAVCLNFEVA